MLRLLAQVSPLGKFYDDGFDPRAASNLYSGVIFSWLEMDVKKDMDSCFPDDSHLGKLIDKYMALVEKQDIEEANKILPLEEALFAKDIQ